jgi:hypothetical protein
MRTIKLSVLVCLMAVMIDACVNEENSYRNPYELQAKNWLTKNTNPIIWSSKQNRIAWHKASLLKTTRGAEYIVLPFTEYKHFDNSELTFARNILLRYQDGYIVKGIVLDIAGVNEQYLSAEEAAIVRGFAEEANFPAFSGSIFAYDLNFRKVYSAAFVKGEVITTPSIKRALDFPNNGRTSNDYMCINYYYYGSSHGGWDYLGSECYGLEVLGDNGANYGNDPIYYDDPGSSGVTYSDGYDTSTEWPSYLVINTPDPGDVIKSSSDYLKCFNINSTATLSIYVEQPNPNSRDTWAGSAFSPEVGHTFISIQQGNFTRVLGFYPSHGVNPFTDPSDNSALVDDSGHPYDVKIDVNLSSAQLKLVLDYIKVYPNTYDLNNYNCTDFGIKIADLGGVKLKDTIGSWPGGGGSNPGDLGQDIRNTSSLQKKTSSGVGLSNSGSCN